jgi:hypothetical protein
MSMTHVAPLVPSTLLLPKQTLGWAGDVVHVQDTRPQFQLGKQLPLYGYVHSRYTKTNSGVHLMTAMTKQWERRGFKLR